MVVQMLVRAGRCRHDWRLVVRGCHSHSRTEQLIDRSVPHSTTLSRTITCLASPVTLT